MRRPGTKAGKEEECRARLRTRNSQSEAGHAARASGKEAGWAIGLGGRGPGLCAARAFSPLCWARGSEVPGGGGRGGREGGRGVAICSEFLGHWISTDEISGRLGFQDGALGSSQLQQQKEEEAAFPIWAVSSVMKEGGDGGTDTKAAAAATLRTEEPL